MGQQQSGPSMAFAVPLLPAALAIAPAAGTLLAQQLGGHSGTFGILAALYLAAAGATQRTVSVGIRSAPPNRCTVLAAPRCSDGRGTKWPHRRATACSRTRVSSSVGVKLLAPRPITHTWCQSTSIVADRAGEVIGIDHGVLGALDDLLVVRRRGPRGR